MNVSAAFLIKTGCRGFVQLDVRGGGRGGLLEGTDPEPLLTFLVIMKAALLFSYKHGVKDKDKWVFVEPTSLCLPRKLDHETHGSER